MMKINLLTSLDEFASILLENSIDSVLPNSGKAYNSYFLYLSVCNHPDFLDVEKKPNGEGYARFKLFKPGKNKTDVKKYRESEFNTSSKVCEGFPAFKQLVSNNRRNKTKDGSYKEISIFSRQYPDKKGYEHATHFAKETVQHCTDLRSVVQTIEQSGKFDQLFVKHVTNKIKPLLEAGANIEQGEIKVQTIYTKIEQLIRAGNKQLILTGPPGTGKTFIAQKVANELGGEINLNNFVQFHPSYDYVDFIEGIRPFENPQQEMVFKKTDGIFKNFCRKVAELNAESEAAKNQYYFFIIDEINRADLSKVFGELLFALEEDKRGKTIATQYAQLPTYYYNQEQNETVVYASDIFKDGFFVPENIIILATMNDIDRSVEGIDFAFRRRFKWLQVNVDENLLREAFKSGDFVHVDYINDVINAIGELNEFIKTEGKKFQLNENYFISQGYFKNLQDTEFASINDLLQHVWDVRIRLTIAEYVRGEDDAESFLQKAKEKFIYAVLVEEVEDELPDGEEG